MIPNYFHIGLLKTGTTSIQHVLSNDNRFNLIRSRHFNTNDWYKKKYDYCVKGKINIESDENIIRSSSQFSGLLSSINRIHSCNPNAHIIITIRRQKDLLVSAYKHHISKTADSYKSFEDFLDSGPGKSYLAILDYNLIYEVLHLFFERNHIHFLLFEQLQDDYKEFYKQFYSIFDVETPKHLTNVKVNIGFDINYTLLNNKLNRFKIFSNMSFISKLEFALHKKICATLHRLFLSNKPQGVVWNSKSCFLSSLEKEFIKSNEKFEKKARLSLTRYGYY